MSDNVLGPDMTHEGRYVYLNPISFLFLPYLDIQLVVENKLCRVGVDTKIGIKVMMTRYVEGF